MFHFFACFFGTIQYISPLLYSWAIAGCECFPLDLSLCRWPCKLPGHTVRVGVAHKELRALDFGGLFFLCNILDSLQSKYFFFFWSRRTDSMMPASIFIAYWTQNLTNKRRDPLQQGAAGSPQYWQCEKIITGWAMTWQVCCYDVDVVVSSQKVC